ncbi:MAG: hypothetical protein GF311_14350 [Candidatus Lokiarchaeota archaeon]|nr:hypothetical protein [Candidatus Lokiarchaeota archaeon]
MSKKIAIASILCVVLGGVAIPGGIFLNNFIADLTYSSVDEGLIGIKEQGIPIIKNSVHEVGPKALAVTFDLMREKGIEASGPVVNATIFMNQVYTIESLGFIEATVETIYFDKVELGGTTFSALLGILNYPPIKGISEWYQEDLNFTTREDGSNNDIWGGVKRLKYGVNATGWWGNRLPGLFEDTYRRVGDSEWPPESYADAASTIDKSQDRGFGVLEILELIEKANQDQIDDLVGPNGYNFSDPYTKYEYMGVNYTKLEILSHYYSDYFVKDVFGSIIEQFNTPGTPLYDAYPQYRPRDWNNNSVTYLDIAYYSYIEQWTKCLSYDDGADLHNSEPAIPQGTYGLEPGGPGNSSGIPMQAALQLWNKTNPYSLLNESGINLWYEAYTNDTVKNELLSEFSQYPGYEFENATYGESDWGFNETEIDLLLDWLWGDGGGWDHGSFYDVTLPKLIYDEIAFEILLEQWANGTIFGDALYPDGFPLPLGDKIAYGFEVGIPDPTNMSLDSALALWNISSDYSLVSKTGLQKWFAAIEGDTATYSELKTANALTNERMDLIIRWLPNFQKNVMPHLAQYQYNLPADSITLGNTIQLGGVLIGGITLGLGSTGLARNYVVKTRIRKKTLPKSKKEMEGSISKVNKKLDSTHTEKSTKKPDKLTR